MNIEAYNDWNISFTSAHLFPSRFRKCGYCRLKCKSKSVSRSGVVLLPPEAIPLNPTTTPPPLPPPTPAFIPMPPVPNGIFAAVLVVEEVVPVADCDAVTLVLLTWPGWALLVVVVVKLMGVPVEETHAVAVRADSGTGISWERSVRLELCILTASDSEDKSAGSGVSSDRRVIVSEHSLYVYEVKQ